MVCGFRAARDCRCRGACWPNAPPCASHPLLSGPVTTAASPCGPGALACPRPAHLPSPRHHPPISSPSPCAFTPPKVLLILDCNHILCERHPQGAPLPTDAELRSHAHAFVKPGGLVWERPFSTSFVDWCMQRFCVAIWSSGKRKNMDPLYQHLLTRRRLGHCLFQWCQEECSVVRMPVPQATGDYAESAGRSGGEERSALGIVEASAEAGGGGGGGLEAAGGDVAAGRKVGEDAGGESSCSKPPCKPPCKPLILKELNAVWRRWPCWDVSSTVILDDDLIKCQRNPPHTTVVPSKWTALSPPPGSAEELAPNSRLYAYLDALSAAPDTRCFIQANLYSPVELEERADRSPIVD